MKKFSTTLDADDALFIEELQERLGISVAEVLRRCVFATALISILKEGNYDIIALNEADGVRVAFTMLEGKDEKS
jgi:hypothetical protein